MLWSLGESSSSHVRALPYFKERSERLGSIRTLLYLHKDINMRTDTWAATEERLDLESCFENMAFCSRNFF